MRLTKEQIAQRRAGVIRLAGHPNFEVELNYLDTIDALEAELATLQEAYRMLAYDFCYEICDTDWNSPVDHVPPCKTAHELLALLPAKDGKVSQP